MHVSVLKLTSGEEIIAEILDDQQNDYILCCNPFAIGHADGKLVFVHFMPYTNASEHCKIFKAQIVVQVEPVQGIYANYVEANSKVIAPSTKLIIPGGN